MQSRAIEIFYLFFQGVLLFQALAFLVIYFINYKKDILYYSFFLIAMGAYFFINAPFTFFGIPEEVVWDSQWYDYVNTPVIILANFFYILFHKAFFSDLTKNRGVVRVFRFVLRFILLLLLLFIVLTILKRDRQFIYYAVKIIAVFPAMIVTYIILKEKLPFARLIALGLACVIIGAIITARMDYLFSEGTGTSIFSKAYPFFFIRVGILGEMIFYLMARLKKWNFQEKQNAVEKLQSQFAVEKLRNKISGELHDDLGSTLSGISMYSYMINDLLQSGKYEEAKQSADIIQKSAGEMVHNLNELVWTINPEQDTLQKLIERLEEFATNMAALKNMKLQISIPDSLKEIILPVESRRNIYLFCKEAINNAVKYSGGSLLELKIKEANGRLEFSVNDDGNGFDEVMVRRGNGLENMQKRADEIGAMLTIQSKKGEGARLAMQLKIT